MSELSEDTKALLVRARPGIAMEAAHKARLKGAVLANIAAATVVASSATAAASGGVAIAKILAAFGIGAGLAVGVLVVRHEMTPVSRSAVSDLPRTLVTASANPVSSAMA